MLEKHLFCAYENSSNISFTLKVSFLKVATKSRQILFFRQILKLGTFQRKFVAEMFEK